jgi:hypothetical protein
VGYYLQPRSKHGHVPVGYGLKLEGENLVLRKPVELKALAAAKAMDVKVPTRMQVTFQDSSKTVIERENDRFRQSFLDEFSWAEKIVIKRFMGGEVKTFKGMGKLDGSRPAAYDFFLVD